MTSAKARQSAPWRYALDAVEKSRDGLISHNVRIGARRTSFRLDALTWSALGEIARRDAPPTPFQLQRSLPRARQLFPLGEAVDAKPWVGARPCLPDMLPVIGQAPRHRGLWFDFGHQHHGLTLGPVTGRLLAEMMTGETPFADPRPYAAERFS